MAWATLCFAVCFGALGISIDVIALGHTIVFVGNTIGGVIVAGTSIGTSTRRSTHIRIAI